MNVFVGFTCWWELLHFLYGRRRGWGRPSCAAWRCTSMSVCPAWWAGCSWPTRAKHAPSAGPPAKSHTHTSLDKTGNVKHSRSLEEIKFQVQKKKLIWSKSSKCLLPLLCFWVTLCWWTTVCWVWWLQVALSSSHTGNYGRTAPPSAEHCTASALKSLSEASIRYIHHQTRNKLIFKTFFYLD